MENNTVTVSCPETSACENMSYCELGNTDEEVNVVVCQSPDTADIIPGKITQPVLFKGVSFVGVVKQPVAKLSTASTTTKVSKTVLEGIESLYGSHYLETIAMAIALTPAKTKNIIKDMKAGKYGSSYKNTLLKIDKSIKNTKNAKYIIN